MRVSSRPERIIILPDGLVADCSRSQVCVGRWFAIAEMKLLITHFLTHYEFETMSSMPKGFSLATMLIPSLSHKVSVRARQDQTKESEGS
jgi:hypothetical protein